MFSLPGNEAFADSLASHLGAERGEATIRSFPDGETYVRVEHEIDGRATCIVGTLDHPDGKVLPLLFLAETLRDLGATQVGLVAPYLAYMRQDKRFQPGEGITSRYFARMLSCHIDWLTTVDPHLHRYDSLNEIYDVPTRVAHAAPAIADWIAGELDAPLLVGPDSESEQWVSDIAHRADAPYIVLHKKRRGDRDVRIEVPSVDDWLDHTPVLVDDIISTANTMAESARQLQHHGLPAPLCIGVHAILTDDAADTLDQAGVSRTITCDTIPHPTNGISVVEHIAEQLPIRG